MIGAVDQLRRRSVIHVVAQSLSVLPDHRHGLRSKQIGKYESRDFRLAMKTEKTGPLPRHFDPGGATDSPHSLFTIDCIINQPTYNSGNLFNQPDGHANTHPHPP